MSMDVVRAYKEARATGDIAAARHMIADDLKFQGPMDTFTNADDTATALMGLAQVTVGIRWHALFAHNTLMAPPTSLLSTASTPRSVRWNARNGMWCVLGLFAVSSCGSIPGRYWAPLRILQITVSSG